MKYQDNVIKASAPGRVCLFGEHQDYLSLPVIPSAISLRVEISGKVNLNRDISLDLPDISSQEKFNMNEISTYSKERDYFKSAVNVLIKDGYKFNQGFTGTVSGNIPINSGTSSSTALIVAWIKVLNQISAEPRELSFQKIAEYAYSAEVLEFGEPGGRMDMYACSFGGTFFLELGTKLNVYNLGDKLKTFVIGDSGEPKDTKEILSRVKNGVLTVVDKIKMFDAEFNLINQSLADIKNYDSLLSESEISLLEATLRNYEITKTAQKLLLAENVDDKELGKLLTEHHKILDRELKISTPKINKMLDAAIGAGAYGGKINGSGGGGCMFVYAPVDSEKVAVAIEKVGGRTFVVKPDSGVKIELNQKLNKF